MTSDEILLDVEERMEKAVGVLRGALMGIRTGRANPGLVDSFRVEVYGSPTPIKQVASVGAPEPNQIVIRPYDPGTLKDIEKAIQASDLGFNPQSDGRVIRLNIPPLSTEVRRKMVGRVRDLAEETKVALRNVRRDGNKRPTNRRRTRTFRKTMDDVKEQIQDLTKQYEGKVTEMARAGKKR